MREVGNQCRWESVSKIPPRGRRVGGRRLSFERRGEEVGGETGMMVGLVGCGRAAEAPGPAGEGMLAPGV